MEICKQCPAGGNNRRLALFSAPWRQRDYNRQRKPDSSHSFTQKSFKRDDISVNIGFKYEAHAAGCETTDVKAPTQSSVCQQVTLSQPVCQELITAKRGSEKRQEVCENVSTEAD